MPSQDCRLRIHELTIFYFAFHQRGRLPPMIGSLLEIMLMLIQMIYSSCIATASYWLGYLNIPFSLLVQ